MTFLGISKVSASTPLPASLQDFHRSASLYPLLDDVLPCGRDVVRWAVPALDHRQRSCWFLVTVECVREVLGVPMTFGTALYLRRGLTERLSSGVNLGEGMCIVG